MIFFSSLLKDPSRLALPCALLLIANAAAQVLRTGASFAEIRAGQPPQLSGARVDTAQSIFEFHSGFWMNLHHFLYQQALEQKQSQAGGNDTAAGIFENKARLAGLAPGERRAWASALDYYQKSIAGRDLLNDGELVKVNYLLADAEAAPSLQKSGLPSELVNALELAAPVYRADLWNEHDRANRAWIAGLVPMLQKYGGEVTKELASAYRTEWPAGPIRAEVTVYADRHGAYTTLDPTLITISSTDRGNQGPAALETIFHEASHALIRGVQEGIEREFAARHKPVPRGLWHAVLFYTTGEIVRRTLAKDGQSNYMPYAYSNGLYARVPGWRDYQRVLERDWQPYLDGKTDFDHALRSMAADL